MNPDQRFPSRTRLTALAIAACALPSFASALQAAPQDVLVGMRWLDVDGDGALDRLRFGPDGEVSVEKHVGGRIYEPVRQELPTVRVADVLASDLDGDGALDLYLVSPEANAVLLGDGAGGFAVARGFEALADAGIGRSAERVDLDADGRAELLLHNANGDVVFWANAAGGFERDPASVTELSPRVAVPVVAGTERAEPASEASSAAPRATDSARRPAAPGRGASASHNSVPGSAVAGPLNGATGNGNQATVLGVECTKAVSDFVNPGNCIPASSIPMLGMLFPISTEWYVDAATGNVGIGTTTPDVPLQVAPGPGLSLEAGGTIQSGNTGGKNVAFGNESIQARQAGVENRLFINPFGGNVLINTVGGTGKVTVGDALQVDGAFGMPSPTAGIPVHLDAGGPVTLADGGECVAGNLAGQNLAVGASAVQSRLSGAESNLFLNPLGGNVLINTAAGSGKLRVGHGLQVDGNFGMPSPTAGVPVHVDTGTSVTLSDGGEIVLGSLLASNLAMGAGVLQNRTNGSAGSLSINPLGGNMKLGSSGSQVDAKGNFTVSGDVGIPTLTPGVPFHLNKGGTAGLTSPGELVMGPIAAENLVFDGDEIQARSNGAKSRLALNRTGGDVTVDQTESGGNLGIHTASPENDLHVRSISPNTDGITLSGGGTVQIGDQDSPNLVMSRSAIQGRNNGAASTLAINELGGLVTINEDGDGHLAIGKDSASGAMCVIEGGDEDSLRLNNDDATTWAINIKNAMDARVGGFRMTDDGFLEASNGTTNGGNVSALLNNTGNWNSASDRRLKTDFEALEGVLERAMELEPYAYRFIGNEREATKDIGFIAQDVREQFPSLIEENGEYLYMNYAGLGVVALAALRELKTESDARIDELERANDELAARLEAIEMELSRR